ncbi:hypothetical protein CLCR_10602 [Cladophialophora carrionii]|uniref:Uncharacterized protein n=1 Tax=Cladophialophora carrionii TaxID=86049 RepID=A0A1C1CZJ2_9EURO|nr:hypothetical protein CLCR_10602 [Cladophialophora carrionii]
MREEWCLAQDIIEFERLDLKSGYSSMKPESVQRPVLMHIFVDKHRLTSTVGLFQLCSATLTWGEDKAPSNNESQPCLPNTLCEHRDLSSRHLVLSIRMAASSSSESNFWLVAAPSPNFEEIPTIKIGDHEVPLPSYFLILGLVEIGRSEDQIVQDVMQHTGTKALHVVTEIVHSVAQNQRLLTTSPKSSKRFSVALKKSKRTSDYRASRVAARREQVVEEQLETAKQTEKKILNEAMILSQRKDELKGMKMTPEQRRRTLDAVEQQMKQMLRKHHDVETEISHARRLSVIHKASLA